MTGAVRPGLTGARWCALVGAALLAECAMLCMNGSAPLPDEETLAAMETFVNAQAQLWAARDARVDDLTRAELGRNDPLRTGLVGAEWSWLTTTPGDLSAKRTTTHPAWVAVFRAWFRQAGLKPGNTVSIGASGSFPGMLLAARIAAESMGLNPRVVGSLTASNYGANLPEMDLAEMDRVLRDAGLLRIKPLAYTPGGSHDRASDLGEMDRERLLQRMRDLGSWARVPESREDSILWRERVLLGQGEHGDCPCRLFINIGGHEANYGVGAAPLTLPSGLIPVPAGNATSDQGRLFNGDSVIQRALKRGIPVINILNIRGLAAQYGVPFDPAVIPPPATVSLPSRNSPRMRVVAGMIGLALVSWLILWRVRVPSSQDWFHLATAMKPEWTNLQDGSLRSHETPRGRIEEVPE